MSKVIHPKRKHIYHASDVGARASDTITAFAGSWLFLLLHTIWFVAWFVFHLDINLLTNIVSLEAIALAALVLMSQNRTYQRDKARDDTEAFEVEKLVQQQEQIKKLQEEIKEISLQQNKVLDQQNEMLAEQKKTLELLKSLVETRKAQKRNPVLPR